MITVFCLFRKDRQERMGGGVIMYIKDSIQAYEIHMERKQNAKKLFDAI